MSFTAKSIIIDIADNWGHADYLGLRSVEFKLAGSLLPITNFDPFFGEALAYATTNAGWSYLPEFAFNTSLDKTGSYVNNAWQSASGSAAGQRLIIVFATPLEFDEIVINNGHSFGGLTDTGAQNTKIYISDDAITSTVYGEAISNSDLLFEGVLTEHSGWPPDDQSPTLAIFSGTIITVPTLTTTTGASVEVVLLPAVANPDLLYFFTLTGAPDGLADVQIPISSFQARRRSGTPSYLSVTIPGTDYSSQIAARANGELVIRLAKSQAGVVYHSEEIIRVSLEEIRPDGGGRNNSTTLSGHGTASFSAKTVAVARTNISYLNEAAGKTRLRLARPEIFLNPGDTVDYTSGAFVVDSISFAVSVDQQTMELAE